MHSTEKAIKVLFLPVSSPTGLGEYMRSACIANALGETQTRYDIRFVLNGKVPYVDACSYPVYTVPASPTRCTAEVIEILEDWKPDVAIFDASGRVDQLKCCHRLKIKTLYIAQHNKKLRRALSWRRLRYTDAIAVVQPECLTGKLSFWSKLKLRQLRKPDPVIAGPVFPEVEEDFQNQVLAQFNLREKNYFFVCAGGGGNRLQIDGKLAIATDFFMSVAKYLAGQVNVPVVVVLGEGYTGQLVAGDIGNLKVIKQTEMDTFNVLLKNAHAAVLSGGSTLLQAIAVGVTNIVSIPVARDQDERVRRCAEYFNVMPALPDIQAAERVVSEIVRIPSISADAGGDIGTSSKYVNTAKVANGLGEVVAIIQSLAGGCSTRDTGSSSE